MASWDEVEIFRRDTQPFKWILTKPDGQRAELIGWTAKLSAKESTKDPDSAAVFDVDVTLDVENGTGEVTLTAAHTAKAGRYVVDLRLLKPGVPTPADARERTIHQFLLTILEDVL